MLRGAIGKGAGVADLATGAAGVVVVSTGGEGDGGGDGLGKPGNGGGNPGFIWGIGARIDWLHFGQGPSVPACRGFKDKKVLQNGQRNVSGELSIFLHTGYGFNG